MSYLESYKQWLESPSLNDGEKAELQAIKDNPKEIEERFFAPLEFGTAGLRGVMETGLRRMNRHIVRRTTQALAELILREFPASPTVAVCYDTRNNSEFFAQEAASVFAANGVTTRLFKEARPTPELSFAIRHYSCSAGINITASHNPKEYNGYKVYWSDGAQLPPAHAEVVAKERDKVSVFSGVKYMPLSEAEQRGLLIYMGDETDDAYLGKVYEQSLASKDLRDFMKDFKIVFTPFHGTGRDLVPKILKRAGFLKTHTVAEQMTLDGNFPTVKSPNPEDKEGFQLAVGLAWDIGADLIIGTDPDADRVGIMVRAEGGFVPLSGNQTGVLLLDYIIKARNKTSTMPEKPAFIKTIVTTPLAAAVAAKNNIASYDTFTGFKFMAEKIKELESIGSQFILAYEESYGYLVGDQARDKDAVVASMLIAEMAAFYAQDGLTLYDALESLYAEYGRYTEETLNITMPGKDGLDKMRSVMKRLKDAPLSEVAGVKTIALRNYLSGERILLADNKIEKMPLSGSNVLCLELSDGSIILIRPSGTEPKMKIYIMTRANDKAESLKKIESYKKFMSDEIIQNKG